MAYVIHVHEQIKQKERAAETAGGSESASPLWRAATGVESRICCCGRDEGDYCEVEVPWVVVERSVGVVETSSVGTIERAAVGSMMTVRVFETAYTCDLADAFALTEIFLDRDAWSWQSRACWQMLKGGPPKTGRLNRFGRRRRR
ncbi:MAG: hypothetical protein ABSC37_21890 [Xanthobacteraceae bacterium]